MDFVLQFSISALSGIFAVIMGLLTLSVGFMVVASHFSNCEYSKSGALCTALLSGFATFTYGGIFTSFFLI